MFSQAREAERARGRPVLPNLDSAFWCAPDEDGARGPETPPESDLPFELHDAPLRVLRGVIDEMDQTLLITQVLRKAARDLIWSRSKGERWRIRQGGVREDLDVVDPLIKLCAGFTAETAPPLSTEQAALHCLAEHAALVAQVAATAPAMLDYEAPGAA